jgi:ribosomal protein S15P/S13E
MGKKSDLISGKEEEIALLTERIEAVNAEINELREDQESERKSWVQKERAMLMETDALKHEIEVITEMHSRLLLRVQAESAAYAARIPDDRKK